MKTEVTAEQVRAVLSYDKETGVFHWKTAPRAARKAGAIAGGKNRQGYFTIRVFREGYLSHRLAWLYVHGVWPAGDIDHIDGDRSNNRIANLRDVSRSVNLENRKGAKCTNKLKILGVSMQGDRFRAQIQVKGVKKHIGLYATAELAEAAYLAVKRSRHEGCTI